jgi:hypothetical protein
MRRQTCQRSYATVPASGPGRNTTGLVGASSTPVLMRLVASGQLDAGRFVTHRFTCDQGHGIIRRARHVHGVVAVRDRLDYPPPGPGPLRRPDQVPAWRRTPLTVSSQ